MTEEAKKQEKKEAAVEAEKPEKKEPAAEAKKPEKKEPAAEAKKPEKKEPVKELELSTEAKGILKKIGGLSPEEKKALGLEIVKKLTVLELSDWVKSMEEEFGVSAAAPMAAMAAAPAAGAGGDQKEEQTSFQVVLASIGDKKIQVIKEVRAVTDLGLKEAKELVEGAPKAVKEGVSKEEAEEIKKKIEAVGATVEIK